jgi:HrpA-like RNA helicase
MKLQRNKQPKLNLPTFTVDGELSKKLNEYEITKLMNKSNVTLFLGKAGSGKTSLMVSFLNTPGLFYKLFHSVFLFMPPNSRDPRSDHFLNKNMQYFRF